jgi:hypothetical protein
MTMAKPNDTSKSRPGRNSAAAKAKSVSSPPKSAKVVPTPEALEDIVEGERIRLMKAHSILSCVITAMEDEDISPSGGPYWPAVIETACDLLNESIRRLEDLDYSPKPASRKHYDVREPAPDRGYGNYGALGGWSLPYGETAKSADIAAAREPSLKSLN